MVTLEGFLISIMKVERNSAPVYLTPRVSENVIRSRPCAARNFSSCGSDSGGKTWQTAKDRWLSDTTGYFRINTQERQLSKKRTKRQTKNLFDCVKLQITQKSGRSGNSFKQGLQETALNCSAYLVEKLTDQPMVKVDSYFELLFPESELGRFLTQKFSTKNEARSFM